MVNNITFNYYTKRTSKCGEQKYKYYNSNSSANNESRILRGRGLECWCYRNYYTYYKF